MLEPHKMIAVKYQSLREQIFRSQNKGMPADHIFVDVAFIMPDSYNSIVEVPFDSPANSRHMERKSLAFPPLKPPAT